METKQKTQFEKNLACLEKLGQTHILKYWDELNPAQKKHLQRQIEALDCGLLQMLTGMATGKGEPLSESLTIEPGDVISLADREKSDAAALPPGEQALRRGEVAVFLVAGGQGTRLDISGPKGKFPITPLKNKSLFQLHAEKIRATARKYQTVIPWYIMTSIYNHEETVAFFKENGFFGLNEADVRFFSQDMLPTFDKEGKILLSAKNSLALSPNGHGGSVKALWDSGAINDMKDRGIRYIFYFQVDNVLAVICDPFFIGYHILAGAEMSNKVVRKVNPQDKVGVVCKINGRDGVVEYSDLSEQDMYARSADGELKYWAGSIAIHVLNVDFIERENREGFKLPYHKAVKKIPFIDNSGVLLHPAEKNGIKFETFVFDLLQHTQKTCTVEVERQKEFSALKNKSGFESPATARKDLLRYYASLLNQAGVTVEVDEQGYPLFDMEISPLFALNAQDIKEKINMLPEIRAGVYLK